MGYAFAMPGIGVPELLIILVILLLIFGPKRLPGLGRQLGGGMREFKESITGKGGSEDEEDEAPAAPRSAALPEAPPPAGAPAAEPAERDSAAHPRG